MAIPKQVEQQMKEIEELERALTAPPEGDAPPEPAQPAELPPTEPVEPPPEAKPVEDWEQKYKSLQGHFNAEVPRLHQQNKELVSQLQALQAQVDALQTPKAPPVEDQFITSEDDERYGADLVDMVRRASKEEISKVAKAHMNELAARDAKIAALEAQLGKTSGDISTLTFEQRLERAIPDFHQINADPRWIAWLDGIDAYTGEPRRSYAEFVYANGNVEKLKSIVDYYKSSTGQQALDQQRQQRQTELERQVQPTRKASASTPSQGERFYTEAEATRLWNKVRTLYSQGKNEEADSLETELTHATVQGRIRG